MEMMQQQLVSMGFPEELAVQALAATGGESTVRATEWILNHTHKPTTPCGNDSNPNANPNTNPSPATSSTPFQPRIDSFFHFQSKPSSSISHSPSPPATAAIVHLKKEREEDGDDDDEDEQQESLARKRPKQQIAVPSSTRTIWPPRPPSSGDKPPPPPSPPHEPLSERMRPCTIDEVVGQDHLLGNNSLLRSAINCNRLPSIVFWGPPGTGKTSIARAIVASSSSSSYYRFVSLSAVTSGVKEVRDAVEEARRLIRLKNSNKKKRTVLFVDEVHRFNKSQQD